MRRTRKGWRLPPLLALLLGLLLSLAPLLATAQPGVGGAELQVFVREGCPHCAHAKAFLPEIKRGYALTHVYDAAMFPFTDPAEEADWTVEHNGKIVRLPRPIAELRVWNAAAKDYEAISPRMEGAPSDEDKDSYWQSFLQELSKTVFIESPSPKLTILLKYFHI